jgi:hypothetical protein
MRRALVIVFLLMTGGAATAQTPPDIGFSPSGHIITKKMLADCRRQATIRKLNYIRKRAFVRKCVGL